MVPIESAPGQSHRMAYTIRVPRGVVCGISSFNSPLNMVVHKVAPALASGNTVVMKPPDAAPLSATRFCELLLEAGFPPGHINLVHGQGATLGPWLVANPDIAFFTFTGSTRVGQWLHANVGLRPVALELGSIAATIVCDDADLDRAATRSAASGFRRAGQMCTSTQRLFVHEAVFEAFTEKLLAAVRALKVGDPRDPRTDVGPMISEAEAARAEAWVGEAVAAGARLLTGGRRDGPVFHPTVLAGVDPAQKVVCEEIFAPVLSLIPFRDSGRGDRCRQCHALRPGGGPFHQRSHAGVARDAPPPLRRRPPQRVVQQSRGPDSVQRREAERARPRGPEVRDAGNDRGTPGHHQPFVGVSRS